MKNIIISACSILLVVSLCFIYTATMESKKNCDELLASSKKLRKSVDSLIFKNDSLMFENARLAVQINVLISKKSSVK